MIEDLRFGFRQLYKAPAFTFAAVLVLMLGIGANTAVFSLVYTMLFAPPGYARPDELVQIFSQDTKNPKAFRAFSYPTLNDLRQQNAVFSDVAGYNVAEVGIGEKNNVRRTFASIVTADYFKVLGVTPVQGRVFTAEEEQPGRAAAVVLVSHGYWTRHNHDPSILGSEVTINGRPYKIIGVLPKTFTGTMAVLSPEVWLPLSAYDFIGSSASDPSRKTLSDRTGEQLLPIGRFKPGTSAAAAGAALKTLAANLERAYPVEQKDQTFITAPLSRFSISDDPPDDSDMRSIAPMLLGMAAVVLLVACLNLANMLLARGTARRKEIAIRMALGSSRWRIVRQLLTEGLLLALLGGAAGLAVGLWASKILALSMNGLLPIDMVWDASPNLPILAMTLGFCLLGTIAFALGPAVKLSRHSVIGDLKEHAGDDVVRRHRRFLPRNPLVVIQIAFSLALLTAAALFIRGANNAVHLDTGLQVKNDLLLEVDASLGGFDSERAKQLYRTLGDRLAVLPGAEHASISATAPFGVLSLSKDIQRAGAHVGKDDKPATAADGLAFNARFNSIGEEYFAALGIPILRGRNFTVAETTDAKSRPVAIIDEALAQKLWPDGDALGQHIQYAPDGAPRAARDDGGGGAGIHQGGKGNIQPEEPIEVVGIVANVRGDILEKKPRGAVYLPFARGFQNNAFFFIQFASLNRSTMPTMVEAVRRAVRETDPTLPVLSLKTFPQHLKANTQIFVIRAAAVLFSVFGAIALALAIVGVYGVKAYSVARRTREIGIRMALGAQPQGVQWMIIREGVVMLAGGVAIGLLLAAATGKLLAGMLYQVAALDPIAFSTAAVILSAATFIATWLPARRATRVSPMTALRTE